jgi:formate hydrogenlyase subunit 6/NADH:ubiquinone oxidoreductase subunit I
MPIGVMLSDILKSLFQKPITQRYPAERTDTPERLRGKLHWDPSKCSGCQLCIKDCPSNAIELIVLDRVNKRFVLKYYADRCTYCAQCVLNCRFKCLSMSDQQWELASRNQETFTVYYGKDEDIQFLLERTAQLEHTPQENSAEPCPAK